MTPGKWLRKQKALAFVNGCVWGAAIVAMGEAIGQIDSVRACPHCGAAASARCYCECNMCGPGECLYWICKTCFDRGRRFAPRPVSDDRGKADE